jgi:chaperonin GroES
MDYKTTQDRVVIEKEPSETISEFGLIMAKLSEQEDNIGRVVAVGPGTVTKQNIELAPSVAVGDRVMFTVGAGIKVNVNGKDLLVMKESDIIGIFDQ